MNVGCSERRIRCMSTSVSEFERKIAPWDSSSRPQRGAVGQVAVVGQRHIAVREAEDERLDVVGGAGAGGGVAHMADRAVAPETLDLAFVGEHLREQAEPAVPDEMAMVVRDDAGALLSAVLQRVQAEVRQSGRVRCPQTPKMPHSSWMSSSSADKPDASLSRRGALHHNDTNAGLHTGVLRGGVVPWRHGGSSTCRPLRRDTYSYKCSNRLVCCTPRQPLNGSPWICVSER